MDKVIPRSINYADIKPEAIENQVKVNRYTPTATLNNARPNDIIRFQLQGQGFYDPYSAYILVEVQCDMTDMANGVSGLQGRFLDRSAHSLINRLVIRSQGTELERIEQYDIAAAMINDMLYSHEQRQLHHIEGFPTKQINVASSGQHSDSVLGLVKYTNTEASAEYAAVEAGIPWGLFFLGEQQQELDYNCLGDQGFWKYYIPVVTAAASPQQLQQLGALGLFHEIPTIDGTNYKSISKSLLNTAPGGVNTNALAAAQQFQSASTLTFCIPIYSGIIGVLMPDKKMLPLSLMPLEVEFTLNPYAFYDVGAVATNNRNYTINKFYIYSHVLFFEQELQRSLEAVTAQQGLFIHFNSFYLAPIATHATSSVLNYAQINIHAKSINSVHFVFIYKGYEQPAGPRKLHFVNHNLKYLQIRNGTDLIPSEPLEGKQDYKNNNNHAQFLLETFKAWNKMHDPTTDACITAYNYCTDLYLGTSKPAGLLPMLVQQAKLGRCQYAISMEGEELGMDKTIITGRKGMIPFDINMGGGSIKTGGTSGVDVGNIASYQFIFAKCDYIVYVRPDLVVTLLGR